MRLKCISASTPDGAEATVRWPVKVGSEYEVLGMGQHQGAWHVIFEHADSEMPVSAPLALFEIVDAQVPRDWRVTMIDGQVSLQPAELDDGYFVDDVQERRGDALVRYRQMKERLRSSS